MGCFTREDLTKITKNVKTSDTVLYNYIDKGYIRRIKRNLYGTVNLVDNELTVNKYQIASAINSNSYISHHTAFEYHGCANQVSYQVDVSSTKDFTSFFFEGYSYTKMRESIDVGIVNYPNQSRVTDIERTVLDGIDQFEKTTGLEELLRCISLVPMLDEKKILSYLRLYDKQFMYQKTGFILHKFQDDFQLSNDFFRECINHIGKSTRYMTNDKNGTYSDNWRIIAPQNILEMIGDGVEIDAYL
jgi:predicted transcriptional regulator of viral defense system